MKTLKLVMVSLFFFSCSVSAQFTGPSSKAPLTTVEAAHSVAVEQYITVTGRIVSHIREDYYLFRDETDEIMIEIEPPVWGNRKIGPDNDVRIIAETGRNSEGTLYLWVESMSFVK
ncbi:MAG: NirD/YgiW/YdeI family stress tolerance protein [Thiotrichales bacterium]|nr:NirD/YgiW/YdeI family stress tolerance protein [Thiotrichales bacterium]